MPEYHLFFVHFPIALYPTALFIEALRYQFRSIPEYVSTILVIIGAIMGIFAGLSGDFAANIFINQTGNSEAISNHESFGNITVWVGLLSAFVLLIMNLRKQGSIFVKWIVLFFLVILVLFTGFLGGNFIQENKMYVPNNISLS